MLKLKRALRYAFQFWGFQKLWNLGFSFIMRCWQCMFACMTCTLYFTVYSKINFPKIIPYDGAVFVCIILHFIAWACTVADPYCSWSCWLIFLFHLRPMHCTSLSVVQLAIHHQYMGILFHWPREIKFTTWPGHMRYLHNADDVSDYVIWTFHKSWEL